MKNKPEDNERKFFQQRFDDFSSEPNDAVWSKIAGELPPSEARPLFLRKRWLFAAAVLIVSTGVISWWALSDTDAATTHTETPKKQSKPIDSQPVKQFDVADAAIHSSETNLPGTTVSQPNSISRKVKTPVSETGQSNEVPLKTEDAKVAKNSRQESTPTKPSNPFGMRKLPSASLNVTGENSDKKLHSIQKTDNESRYVASKSAPTLTQSENTSDLTAESHSPLLAESFDHRNSIFSTLKSRAILLQKNKPTVKSLTFNPLPWKPDIEPQKQKTSKLWSLYAGFTHWMNYYAVTPVVTDSVLVNQVELGQTLSSQRSGWQGQVGIIYPLNERLQVRAGLFYYRQKQQVMYQAQDLYPATSTVTPTGTDEVQVKHTYRKESQFVENQQQNAGLRLDMLYQLGKLGAFRHYVSGGGQVALIRFNENAAHINTDVQLGYGIARPLSRRLECWLEPTFRYSLNNRLDAARYTRIRPYYFGISAGVNLSLR